MPEIFVTCIKGYCMFAHCIFFSWLCKCCGWVLVSSVVPQCQLHKWGDMFPTHTFFFYYISRTLWPLSKMHNHILIGTWLCPIFCEIIHGHSLHSSYILLSPLITQQISFRSDTLYWYNYLHVILLLLRTRFAFVLGFWGSEHKSKSYPLRCHWNSKSGN